MFQIPDFTENLVLCILTDCTSVQQDDICIIRRIRMLISKCRKYAGDAIRVMHVHLAAVSSDIALAPFAETFEALSYFKIFMIVDLSLSPSSRLCYVWRLVDICKIFAV